MSALIQQTEEWLQVRKDKIGSSDAPVIMEVSPWKTPYQLWEEKLLPKKQSKNRAMERGLVLEEKARERFSDMTGLLVGPDVIFHPKRSWMMASLDAIDVERKHIAEIKCPGSEDHELAKKGEVPVKYFPQIQHQLEVCELEMAHYFSFDGENGVLVKVYRDDKYIRKLVEKEEEFLECVYDLIAPKLTERDYVNKEDDIWNMAASEWLSISQELSSLEKREKELRDLLISMCQKQNSKGGGIKVSRFMRKGAVDYAKIPELQHVNLEQYRKAPVECWKILGE